MLGLEILGLIAVILVALWFLGLMTVHILGGILAVTLVALLFLGLVTAYTMVGILLVVAVVVVLVRIIQCVMGTEREQNE